MTSMELYKTLQRELKKGKTKISINKQQLKQNILGSIGCALQIAKDEEQLWQLLQLNKKSHMLKWSNAKAEYDQSDSDDAADEEEMEQDEDAESDEDGSNAEKEESIEGSDEEEGEDEEMDEPPITRTSEMDDEFFVHEELEKELDRLEALEAADGGRKETGEYSNMFDDLSDEENEDGTKKDYMYDDFFKKPRKFQSQEREEFRPRENKRSDILDPDDQPGTSLTLEQDQSIGGPENISAFQKKEKEMRLLIAEQEERLLEPKSWELQGEVTAQQRPEGSLLEADLDFIRQTKPPPVTTVEVLGKLEDLIKKRITNNNFDDPERKIKPVMEPTEYKRDIVLQQEKSKISLAEVYEKEYLDQKQTEKEIEENPLYQEIRDSMSQLFEQLDILFSPRYVPPKHKPHLKLITKLPATTAEEVGPVTMSTSQLVAPEEVQAKAKNVEKAWNEQTQEERLRERKKSKKLKKIKMKAKESKEEKKKTKAERKEEKKQREKAEFKQKINDDKKKNLTGKHYKL